MAKQVAAQQEAVRQAQPRFAPGRFERAQGSKRVPSWQRHLVRNVMLMDAIAIYSAVFVAFILRWGIAELDWLDPIHVTNQMAFTALMLMATWFLGLAISDAWNIKIMGAGAAEYTRVTNVTFAVFSLLAIGSYLLRIDISRSFVGIAFPLGLVFLNFGRWIIRQNLVKERARGRNMSRALMVATPSTAEHLISEFQRLPATGLEIVAVCTPSVEHFEWSETARTEMASAEPLTTGAVPIAAETQPVMLDHLTSLEDILPYSLSNHIDTVIISGVDELTPKDLKQLSWSLEPHHIELAIAPKLTDVASTRMVMHNMGGVPLLHVEKPGYTSKQQHAKRIFDLLGSGILIAIFAIPMALVALIIKITSPGGPVLFKQTRIGVDGQEFKILKFRSMYPDAEARFHEVMGPNIGFINKVKNDPRITPIGKFIRRYSIDELPQLFNVWRGQMSLVGPRPPLASEAKLYNDGVERRLFVRPGMTGLWQVSGRSNLSPAEAMRLDLYYIENWSLTEDLLIMLRTAKAVLGRDGAY